MNRSIDAVKLKAGRLKLGRHLFAGEDITFLELCRALGKEGNYGLYKESWAKHGFPMHYKTSIKKKYRTVNIDDFWKWAENHKNLLDFSLFKENSLGKEPSWVKEKRRADIAALKYKSTPWTKQEDKYLELLLSQYKYGYRQLSEILRRTEGAIKRRMVDLELKNRPLRADNHTPWEAVHIEKVKVMHFLGYKPEIIAGHVNRSACAVRGLIERLAAKNSLLADKACANYKDVLPSELWDKTTLFLHFILLARKHILENGGKPTVNLKELRTICQQTS